MDRLNTTYKPVYGTLNRHIHIASQLNCIDEYNQKSKYPTKGRDSKNDESEGKCDSVKDWTALRNDEIRQYKYWETPVDEISTEVDQNLKTFAKGVKEESDSGSAYSSIETVIADEKTVAVERLSLETIVDKVVGDMNKVQDKCDEDKLHKAAAEDICFEVDLKTSSPYLPMEKVIADDKTIAGERVLSSVNQFTDELHHLETLAEVCTDKGYETGSPYIPMETVIADDKTIAAERVSSSVNQFTDDLYHLETLAEVRTDTDYESRNSSIDAVIADDKTVEVERLSSSGSVSDFTGELNCLETSTETDSATGPPYSSLETVLDDDKTIAIERLGAIESVGNAGVRLNGAIQTVSHTNQVLYSNQASIDIIQLSSSGSYKASTDTDHLASSTVNQALSHTDHSGKLNMVDISGKSDTSRTAVATGLVYLGEEAFRLVKENKLKKGDVLTVAKIAGIIGAKRTSEVVPLCHNIPLSKVDLDLELLEKSYSIRVTALAKTYGKTGVEMEAITAVAIAAITIYDMSKAVTKDIVISDIKLVHKSGGKSGNYNTKTRI